AALEDLFAGERQRVLSGGEDYWYYDVASDGYYYEQNGAKGWRRRMPNSAMQRIKEQVRAVFLLSRQAFSPRQLVIPELIRRSVSVRLQGASSPLKKR
ncbi:hypothetical protein TELCIR_20301, partial [Teladorsagia circumcincta]